MGGIGALLKVQEEHVVQWILHMHRAAKHLVEAVFRLNKHRKMF